MRCFVGIDLGSTTTKALLLDDAGEVLGKGITNSRSNYDTAARVAKQEAMISARFTLLRRALRGTGLKIADFDGCMDEVARNLRIEQFLEQLEELLVAA